MIGSTIFGFTQFRMDSPPLPTLGSVYYGVRSDINVWSLDMA